MTHNSRGPGIYVLGLLVLAGILALWGPDGGVPAQAEPAAPVGARLPDIVGSWTGTWKDTIYMGPEEEYAMTWQISQVREEYCATGIIDFTYFGMGFIPGTAAGAVTGTFRADTLHLTFEGPGIGTGAGAVTGGVGTGAGTVGFPLEFGAFTFQGTVTDTTIRGTFDFPTGGSGWARMGKVTPVERASWGGIKARYRDGDE